MRSVLGFMIVALAGCSTLMPSNNVVESNSRNWRTVATEQDRERLHEWRTAFISALAAARKSGHADEIAAEGALLDPDSATGGVPIPNGLYKCRVIKLGAKSPGLLDYVAYPYFRCRIGPAQGVQGFAKLSGSQRHVGLIYPSDAIRQVFLGTLELGDEQRAMQYGADEERNVAGFVERIGPARWRLIMPYPHFESQMDVMELIPAS
ncbi:MAG TPA: DUF4893 domain-containing protein [Sphingomicrobium sp.]|nr:DUF4893 domain-containing protein [Sphingomicrobium sp.]